MQESLHEMLIVPSQSFLAWRICVTVAHSLAILSSIYRILTRYKSQQMWFDDYIVIIPLVVDFLFCLFLWIPPSVLPDPLSLDPRGLTKIWVAFLLLFTVIWFSRICFALSLVRLFPTGSPNRRRLLCVVVFFALGYSASMMLLALHCDPMNPHDRNCIPFLGGDPATTYAYTMDAVSDIIMFICPLAVLWKVKLPRVEKRVILAALSGSIVTLILFIVLMVFTYGPFLKLPSVDFMIVTTMVSHLTAAAALMSCNSLVIVTAVYRKYRRRVTDAESGPKTATKKAEDEIGTVEVSSAPSFAFTSKADPNGTKEELESHDVNLDSSGGYTSGSSSAGLHHTLNLTEISWSDNDARNWRTYSENIGS